VSASGALFVCNAVDVFDLFGLKQWAKDEIAAGRIPDSARISVEVRHPDREMDGSCRWCGCRQNEVIEVDV
jgi:hypothetical protein